jgi:hypothetical protein
MIDIFLLLKVAESWIVVIEMGFLGVTQQTDTVGEFKKAPKTSSFDFSLFEIL